MTTEEIVKKELKELKYYYSRKENMDELLQATGTISILTLIEKYNKFIVVAPIRIYDLYGCLYIQNKTQEAVAIEWGYAQDSVRKFHRELIKFFVECIENERRYSYGQD